MIKYIDDNVYKTTSKPNKDIQIPLQNYGWLSKLNSYSFKYANIFTEIQRNFAFNNKQYPYVLFSCYRINVHDMSFVVTKKGQTSKWANTLRKKIAINRKRSTKKHLLFVTCSNDKKGTKRAKNQEQINEKPGSKKNVRGKEQNCDSVLNKNLNENVTKKSKKTQKDDRVKVCNKKSNPRIERLHAKCSKYWKNISDVLSCTESIIIDIKKDFEAIEEKKHKRKKKHKNYKDNAIKYHKSRNNNEDARQFRISSYLADQEWKKKKLDDKAEIGSSLKLNTQEFFEENEVEVNHVGSFSSKLM